MYIFEGYPYNGQGSFINAITHLRRSLLQNMVVFSILIALFPLVRATLQLLLRLINISKGTEIVELPALLIIGSLTLKIIGEYSISMQWQVVIGLFAGRVAILFIAHESLFFGLCDAAIDYIEQLFKLIFSYILNSVIN